MSQINIPHATSARIEVDPPREFLRVVTGLAEHPAEPGFNANAKHEMLQAIAHYVGDHRLNGHKIIWRKADHA